MRHRAAWLSSAATRILAKLTSEASRFYVVVFCLLVLLIAPFFYSVPMPVVSAIVGALALLSTIALGLLYRRLMKEKSGAQLATKIQAELMQSNLLHIQKLEVLGQLTGGIAHDFNNIVTAILGYTSLIMGDLSPNTTLYRNLNEVHNAGERAVALIAQLMTFSRKRPVREMVIDMKWVLTELERMLRRLIGENITMTVTAESGLWRILGDQAQIEQILVNLVVNARDAMPHGGKLAVSANNVVLTESKRIRPGEYIRLQVQDTGTGIAQENLSHIFEPFFTTKELGRGTGLGLATVAGIVKRLNGDITVDTELGVGTTFTAYIPRELSPVTIVPTTHHKISRGNEIVLVVEDEAQVRILLTTMLRSLGYEVLDAQSGEQATELAATTKDIRLVVSDVVMPGMGVHEAIENVRRLHPRVGVILISGHFDEAIADLVLPDVQIIAKPFSMEMFSAKVREVLDAGGEWQ